MTGLELGGFRAMLHRNDFSVSQGFRSMQVGRAAGVWLACWVGC